MKALFELFRRFDARRIFGFIRRLGGMSRPKVKCYDLRSTRALRVEGDIPDAQNKRRHAEFLSTPSGWRATFSSSARSSYSGFLSTPSGWRATCRCLPLHPKSPAISIHALRVEGDCKPLCRNYILWISIHALRVEGDIVTPPMPDEGSEFLSTPSGWRATICPRSSASDMLFLSTPSGWRATNTPVGVL